jgi:hypothetical protein
VTSGSNNAPFDTIHLTSSDGLTWSIGEEIPGLFSKITSDGRFTVDLTANADLDGSLDGRLLISDGMTSRVISTRGLVQGADTADLTWGNPLVATANDEAILTGTLNAADNAPWTYVAWVDPANTEDATVAIRPSGGTTTPITLCPQDDQGGVGIVSYDVSENREPLYSIQFWHKRSLRPERSLRFESARIDGCFRTPDGALLFTGEECTTESAGTPAAAESCLEPDGFVGVSESAEIGWVEHPRLDEMVAAGFEWTHVAFSLGDGILLLGNALPGSDTASAWYVTPTDAWQVPHSAVFASSWSTPHSVVQNEQTVALLSEKRLLYVAAKDDLLIAVLAAQPS